MNDMNVPISDPSDLLGYLAGKLTEFTPEVRKAAAYILDNPNNVGISSVRELAEAAMVTPNTVVRMAKSAGFSGYDEFRAPFRDQIRNGRFNFPDRARWLQSFAEGGKLSALYADVAASAIANIENTFATADSDQLKAAAELIVGAGQVYLLGVGANYMLANTFAYLADMARDNVAAIPKRGGSAIDDLARAGGGDVLVAMTFKPFRSEVVRAVEAASRQGVKIIAISDSLASPIVALSEYGFIVHTDTPQFFPSTIAAAALLEALIAFVIAEAGPSVIDRIKQLHERRYDLQIYDSVSGE